MLSFLCLVKIKSTVNSNKILYDDSFWQQKYGLDILYLVPAEIKDTTKGANISKSKYWSWTGVKHDIISHSFQLNSLPKPTHHPLRVI